MPSTDGGVGRSDRLDRAHYWPPAAMIFIGIWLPLGAVKADGLRLRDPEETLTFFNSWWVLNRHFEPSFQPWLALGIGVLALLTAALVPSAAESVVAKRIAATACVVGIVAIVIGLLTVGPMMTSGGTVDWRVDLAAAGWLVTAGGFGYALAVMSQVERR